MAIPCRVIIKARPTAYEHDDAFNQEFTVPAPGRVLLGKEFAADRVYLADATADAVYADEVEPLVSSLYQGFNATIFAYGASGSGKTHTILGTKQQGGLVNRVIDGVFERFSPLNCTVSVSIEELYCERFTDLLAAAEAVTPRRPGSSCHKVPHHPGATNKQRKYKCKLYLVDLAGSENIKRSGAEGRQQKEAGIINKSLCHLKTVIEEVYRGAKVSTFRNSKLTYKLQDALGGGNSRLLVIACISTARSDLAETKETLRFAEMARSITNTPVVNKEPKDELIHRQVWLQLQLEELEDELRKAVKGAGVADQLLQQQLNAVEAAYADLQDELETKEGQWSAAAAVSQQQEQLLHQELSATRTHLQDKVFQLQACVDASEVTGGAAAALQEEQYPADCMHSSQQPDPAASFPGPFEEAGSSGVATVSEAQAAAAGLQTGSAWTPAAAAPAIWPQQYLPEADINMLEAGQVFDRLYSEALTTDALKRFLSGRKLGRQPHSLSLSNGAPKRKQELVQDMLAWSLTPETNMPGQRLAAGAEATRQSDSPVAWALETAAAAARGKSSSALEGEGGAAGSPSLWSRLTPKKWRAAAASQQGKQHAYAEAAPVVEARTAAEGGGEAGKLSFTRRSLLLGAVPASSAEQGFAAAGQLNGIVGALNVAKGSREAAGQVERQQYIAAAAVAEGVMDNHTEVPAFIPRDDMMDQMVRWALIEAEEGGQRNFGMPMKVHQRFLNDLIWGIELEIIKEGEKQAELSLGFDNEVTYKSEWIGQDSSSGMPTKEGKQEEVVGKHFEIWKTCDRKVDEDLRATIRAFCTGLVAALNKYYAFGSVFAEEV
eukprot:gene7254-7467_t